MTDDDTLSPTFAPTLVMLFTGVLTVIMAYSGQEWMFTISALATVACAGLAAGARVMQNRLTLKYR